MLILYAVVYIAIAAVAMYWETRMGNESREAYMLEDHYWLIAILWPVAFPLFAAYVKAHKDGKPEEE